ncbi:UNVERIFIED_CONTAM: hypothetical protein NY603_37965, partial [Bacteroidetes bacterium 56_B9]
TLRTILLPKRLDARLSEVTQGCEPENKAEISDSTFAVHMFVVWMYRNHTESQVLAELQSLP